MSAEVQGCDNVLCPECVLPDNQRIAALVDLCDTLETQRGAARRELAKAQAEVKRLTVVLNTMIANVRGFRNHPYTLGEICAAAEAMRDGAK
jgi:hypothetical protein